MTIEIRELVIKTEIRSQPQAVREQLDPEQIKQIKQQVLIDCMRSIKKTLNKNSFNR
jgi:hypothetical protein